ncbi:MAG: gluconeogenesis factor YvcK family protein [Leptolyngbya sp.]|nr:gluconeogenesis factor YvcK family protein [Leptolyngbya sp.]
MRPNPLSNLLAKRSKPHRWKQPPRLSSQRASRLVWWLAPGLLVKRWIFLSVVGVLLMGTGLMIWLKLTPVFYTGQVLGAVLRWFTTHVPSYISGPLGIVLGLGLILWGQSRTVGVITDVLLPGQEGKLLDALLAQRRLAKGPKIVVVGGGTGLSNLLRGLKHYSANITAVVTVADDGGSSGRLRREIGVLPPGDIRNCLSALADEEKLLTELFQYRFEAGSGLVGHSFGNLFLTAMSEITGDLEQAIAASSKVLAVRGQVLPSTLSDVQLWAELDNGRRIVGESKIAEARRHIVQIGCLPPNPPALPKAIRAIEEADYIIIGPGSLYTSIIPNLLVPDLVKAIAAQRVPRIYVCNIMTEPGETEGFAVSDHIRALDAACGQYLFDAVLVQKTPPSEAIIRHYAQEGVGPVILDREAVVESGRRIIAANIMDERPNLTVRHHPDHLARVLLRWYSRAERIWP